MARTICNGARPFVAVLLVSPVLVLGCSGTAQARGTFTPPPAPHPLVSRAHHGPYSVLHQGPFSVLHQER